VRALRKPEAQLSPSALRIPVVQSLFTQVQRSSSAAEKLMPRVQPQRNNCRPQPKQNQNSTMRKHPEHPDLQTVSYNFLERSLAKQA